MSFIFKIKNKLDCFIALCRSFWLFCIATNLEVILLIIVLAGFPCEVGVLPGLEGGSCNDDV